MAEILAAGTVLGVVSSLITFGDVAWKVILRIREYNAQFKDAPKILRKISNQLPLLHETISKWKEDTQAGNVIIDDGTALMTAIIGCNQSIESLGILLEKVLPQRAESKTVRLRKALRSVKYESEVAEIWADIESYRGTLILYFTHKAPNTAKRLSISDNVSLASTATRYNYPNRLVNHYIDRSVDGVPLCEEIEKQFISQTNGMNRSRVVVLLGMGGSGKSQIALRYCEYAKSKGRLKAIFWVDASTPNSVAKAYEEIAGALTGAQPTYNIGSNEISTSVTTDKDKSPLTSLEQIVESVKFIIGEWEIPWMFVFDNHDQPDKFYSHGKLRSIRDYWPTGDKGAILVTSRHESSDRLGETLHVGRMSNSEARRLLLNNIRDSEEQIQSNAATEVVELLGCLALAIDQAGAYIRSQHLKISHYPSHYRDRKEAVLKRIPKGSNWEYQRRIDDNIEETALSVFTTWEMSLSCLGGSDIERDHKLHFLTVAAFFNTFNIRESLFREHIDKSSDGPPWGTLFIFRGRWDTYLFGDFLVELKRLSLLESLERNEQGSCFSFHPLVSEWIRLRLSPDLQDSYATEAVLIMNHSLPRIFRKDNEGKTVAELQALIPHLSQCLQNCTDFHLSEHMLGIDELETPALAILDFLDAWAMFDEIEKILINLLNWREQKGLPWTDHFLNAGMKLIWNYRAMKNHTLVRKWTPEILSHCEQLFGDDNELTMACQTLLGMMYMDEDDYESAKKVLEANYATACSVLGAEHPKILPMRGNLAIMYKGLGKTSVARDHVTVAFHGMRTSLGPDALTTLQMQKFLVELTHHAVDECLPLALDCVSRLEKRLGLLHPQTIDCYFRLSEVYLSAQRCQDARSVLLMVKKALDPFSTTRGFEMAEAFGFLGYSYVKEGNEDMAHPMFENAVAIFRGMGKIHNRGCLMCVSRVAKRYSARGEFTKAEGLWKEVVSSFERAGEQQDIAEEEIYAGYYRLLESHSFFEDSSRMSEIRAVADIALEAAYGIHPHSWQILEQHLSVAQISYSFLKEPELADVASCGLVMLNRFGEEEAICKEHDEAYELALQVALPSPLITIFDALLEKEASFPDLRTLALAQISRHVGDIPNAQIAYELLLSREEFSQGRPAAWIACDICKPGTAISGRILVCTECPDCDIHGTCIDKYQLLEFPLMGPHTTPTGCIKHKFMEVPSPWWISSDKDAVDESGQTVSQWLVSMKEKYFNIDIPEYLMERFALLELLPLDGE